MLCLKNRLRGLSNFEEMSLRPRANMASHEKAHSVKVIRSGGKKNFPVYTSESYRVHNHPRAHVGNTIDADDWQAAMEVKEDLSHEP